MQHLVLKDPSSYKAYELCADRAYTGRLAMFGETVLGFLKQTHKGAPQWTKGVWLGKTLSNDVHIIAVPGAQQLFVTRSVRRLPASKAWNGERIGGVEAPAPLRDFDAEAVMNLPPTPGERPHVPRCATTNCCFGR